VVVIDARSLLGDETFEAQVCIVGSGPAGLTIAREFISQNLQVCLIESGGSEFDEDIQSLCEGTVIGDPYPEISQGRRRQVGGTANCWEGQNGYKRYGFRCLPLDEIDFEVRGWMPYSGWPFTKTELDPFYERAQNVCQLGPYAYDIESWQERQAKPLLFKGDRVTTAISQYGLRSTFTDQYPREIRQADNITYILYANVVEIQTDETMQKVTRLRVISWANQQFWLKAKIIVLATGGLENARLLLASNRQQSAGLGNQYDVVGRYFMDRPILSSSLVPYNHHVFQKTALYDVYPTKHVPIMAHIKVNEAVMRQERLLNNGAQLFPQPLPHQRQATVAIRSLISLLCRGKLSPEIIEHMTTALQGSNYLFAAAVWSIARSIPSLRRGDWSYLPYEKHRFSLFEIYYQMEQAPNPNNRVILSRERDRLGQPKLEIHWCLNDIDIQNTIRIQEIWAEELSQAGIGNLIFTKDWSKQRLKKLAAQHHSGTTRMHNNFRQGVVDSNCKVHGIANLFVAGSSTFPTTGYANPTLTIIALALRLADHIKKLMR
jgi:choline dehydrogenase-like flavoprotein